MPAHVQQLEDNMNHLKIRKGETFAEWKARQPKLECPTCVGQTFSHGLSSYIVISFDDDGIDARCSTSHWRHGYDVFRFKKELFSNYINHGIN